MHFAVDQWFSARGSFAHQGTSASVEIFLVVTTEGYGGVWYWYLVDEVQGRYQTSYNTHDKKNHRPTPQLTGEEVETPCVTVGSSPSARVPQLITTRVSSFDWCLSRFDCERHESTAVVIARVGSPLPGHPDSHLLLRTLGYSAVSFPPFLVRAR